jgi:hypothetical protein
VRYCNFSGVILGSGRVASCREHGWVMRWRDVRNLGVCSGLCGVVYGNV